MAVGAVNNALAECGVMHTFVRAHVRPAKGNIWACDQPRVTECVADLVADDGKASQTSQYCKTAVSHLAKIDANNTHFVRQQAGGCIGNANQKSK